MKPLKDWTLGEIQAECKRCNKECIDRVCPMVKWINKDEMVCAVVTGMKCTYPSEWDLSEPIHWTEQDKEDAANMKRVLPLAKNISRSTKGDLLVDFKGPEIYPGLFVYNGLFPSLKPGESATLDEIIGGGE